MSGWKLVGISDECTECEVCGRVELKSTYHIVTDDGAELRAGSSCGARKLGTAAAKIRDAARAFKMQEEARIAYDRQEARMVVRVLGGLETLSERVSAWRAHCEATGRHRTYIPGPGKLSSAEAWAREVLSA